MADDTPNRPPRLLLFALAAGFALAHTQSPLFFSNQNQYLLHGLAEAGYGHLSHDWLANTRDPTPLFSLFVAGLYKVGGLFAIQAAYFLMLMAYFIAMWQLVESVGSPRIVPFAALFTAAHAAIFRLASVRLTGVDYSWFLQCGVANQYLLGPGLQPSVFGILLVASAAAFARGRPRTAAILAALTADIHATYILPAAFLTLGYAAALLREKQTRRAATVCASSLLAASPMILHVLLAFPSTNPETFREAQHILATVRIPHHAQVSRWLDGIAILQLGWIGLGMWWLGSGGHGSAPRLRFSLLVASGFAIVITVVQAATGNDTLALLFPGAFPLLVPVATAIIAAKLAARDFDSRKVKVLAAFIMLLQVLGGIYVMAAGLGYRMNDDELPMMQFVRDHAGPEDVYLIPTRIPPVGSGKRGVFSTSFTPPPRPQPGSHLIPVDLQRFRLATGTAIYVDFKSVPYASEEVLEWLRRVEQVETWYKEANWNQPEILELMRKEGITHVVAPRQQRVAADFLIPEYQDKAYMVYRIRR